MTTPKLSKLICLQYVRLCVEESGWKIASRTKEKNIDGKRCEFGRLRLSESTLSNYGCRKKTLWSKQTVL